MKTDDAILIMENERPHCGEKLTFAESELCEAYTLALMALRDLSSAQPERKKGKWIPYLSEGLRYKCSECESRYETPWRFCPNCGSYNGGVQSEID